MRRYRDVSFVAALFANAIVGCRGPEPASQGDNGAAGATGGASQEAPPVWKPHSDMPDCRHVEVKEDCRDGWCRIPAGCFVMGPAEDEYGAPSDEYQVSVVLTRPFEIQQTEFTKAQWDEIGLPEPSDIALDEGTPCVDASCPAGNISWYSALLVANKLSEVKGLPACYEVSECECFEGAECALGDTLKCAHAVETAEDPYACQGYRLPTEAEWEYSARAGTQTAFYNGDITSYPGLLEYCHDDANLERIAWYCKNANGAMPVRGREPNAWGLYDMLGNVKEWTSDPFYRLPTSPTTDPRSPWTASAGLERVVPRGGDYNSWAAATRTSWRYGSGPGGGGTATGIRLVRTLPE